MTATAYRMQDSSRDIRDLTNPEMQWSHPMDPSDEDGIRRGVSGCLTLSDLAAYLACYAIQADRPVVVEIEGPYSDDVPCDEQDGEVLLMPTAARVVEVGDEFWEVVSDLVEMRWEELSLTCAELREIAEERLA